MENNRYDFIIAGAGLSGLVLAKQLALRDKKILILERGGFIHKVGAIKYAAGFYDSFALAKSRQGVIIYRVFGVGGTSIVSCGNAVEFSKEDYARMGLDLAEELKEAKTECFVKEQGLPLGRASIRIMQEANKLGYDMRPMPKFNIAGKCMSCGDCVLGCRYGVKWTSEECLTQLKLKEGNINLITNFLVKKVIDKHSAAIGVEGVHSGIHKQRFFADKIILCSGGLGTPVILQNSGVSSGENLFVDFFNITYGISKEYNQKKEPSMSVVCDKFHKDGGFILSPFIDNIASLSTGVEFRQILNVFKLNKLIEIMVKFTDKNAVRVYQNRQTDKVIMDNDVSVFKLNRLMGIMTKIADESAGRVYKNGRVDKVPTENDLKKLKKGSYLASEILLNCGIEPKSIFVTKPKGAHPAGTAAIGKVVNKNLETQMKNLYVCDASVLPFSTGLPPILTLAALAKWFGKRL